MGASPKQNRIDFDHSPRLKPGTGIEVEKPVMNYDAVFLPSVAKLSQLVRHRYNCEFEYESLTQLARTVMAPLRADLLKGAPVCAGDWVFFPIFISEELAGAARVSNRDRFTQTDLTYLHQVIRLVLESSLNNVERLDVLETFEAQMENIERSHRVTHPAHSLNRKVIPLVTRAKNPFPLVSNKNVGTGLNFPFLIEGPSEEDIHKMALEIHSRTNRYAFLRMEFIAPSVFETLTSIHALGGVTLFIEDIRELTEEQRQQITSYYKNSLRSKDSPQFIAGTPVSVTELKKQGGSMAELLNVLMVGYLCMNHPFDVYKRENLLDFFYDSLTGRHPI